MLNFQLGLNHSSTCHDPSFADLLLFPKHLLWSFVPMQSAVPLNAVTCPMLLWAVIPLSDCQVSREPLPSLYLVSHLARMMLQGGLDLVVEWGTVCVLRMYLHPASHMYYKLCSLVYQRAVFKWSVLGNYPRKRFWVTKQQRNLQEIFSFLGASLIFHKEKNVNSFFWFFCKSISFCHNVSVIGQCSARSKEC